MTRRALLGWVTVSVFVSAVVIAIVWGWAVRSNRNSERWIRRAGISAPLPHYRFSFGQGVGEQALGNPLAVLGTSEEVFVSDAAGGSVAVFNKDGARLRTIGRPGSAAGQFRYPYGLALNGDKLYVADMGAATILTFDSSGSFLGNLTQPGLLSKPTSMELHGTELYVADAGLHQVVVLDTAGTLLRRIGSPGEGEGELRFPNGVAVGSDGTVYVSDSGNNRVQVFDAHGDFRQALVSGTGTVPLTAPRGIALSPAGTLYVVAGLSNAVVAFDRTGTELFHLSAPVGSVEALNLPTGIAVDPSGCIYISESGNRRISVYQ